MLAYRSIAVATCICISAGCGNDTGILVSVTRDAALTAPIEQLQFIIGGQPGDGSGSVFARSPANPDVMAEVRGRDLVKQPYRLLLRPDNPSVPQAIAVAVLGLAGGQAVAAGAFIPPQSFARDRVLMRDLVLVAAVEGQDFTRTAGGCLTYGTFQIVSPDDRDCDGDPATTDCNDNDPGINRQATETCGNGVDENCDGAIDEGCVVDCKTGDQRACYLGAAGTENIGVCHGGRQRCVAGQWGPCVNQLTPSGEACNGQDDDCDGMTDELGTISCGIGACSNTVKVCVGGQIQACTPLVPAADDKQCDGIDNDCDGAIDEDCACVHVSPTGNDAMAVTNLNVTPFLTVQAAITWAAGDLLRPKRVCVAAGDTCGASGVYVSAAGTGLTMEKGVSVYGNYEATTWTRCAISTTTLKLLKSDGVLFPAAVNGITVLDGFTIDRFAAGATGTTAAVTVAGATHVVLSNLAITNTPTVANSYGVDLSNGGEALITRSVIYAGNGTQSAIGVRSVGSRPVIRENCADFDAGGRCAIMCGLSAMTPGIRGRLTAGTGESYAIRLEASPGARVEQNTVCGNTATLGAGVRIVGNGDGIVIRGNSIAAFGGTTDAHGVWAEDCGGAAPWIVDNAYIEGGGNAANARVDGIRAAGKCHPVIDSNRLIVGGSEGGTVSSSGIHCAANSAGDAAGCFITGNKLIQGGAAGFPPSAVGVRCDDGACLRIADNETITGRAAFEPVGIWLRRTGTIVESNGITGGCPTQQAAGVRAENAWARLENNRISGGSCDNPALGATRFVGLRVQNAAGPNELDVHSNTIDGRGSSSGSCSSLGVDLGVASPTPNTGSGVYRNNIFRSGLCTGSKYGFREADPSADPRIFENNDLDPSDSPTALYKNENAANLTPAEVNLATDMTASGNISVDPQFVSYPIDLHLQTGSLCIAAGTPSGAPLRDMDGESRRPTPDIGADEH